MNILILSSHDPEDVAHGIGLIVHNSLRCLLDSGNQVRLGVIAPPNDSGRDFSYSQSRAGSFQSLEIIRIARKRYRRSDALRALTRSFHDAEEKRFLREIRTHSRGCDLAIWFGHCWDPLTSEVASASECPILLHVNDSITLSRRQRVATPAGRIQCRLAEFRESSVVGSAKAGRVGIVYVAEEDRRSALATAGLRDEKPVFCLPLAVDTNLFAPAAPGGDGGRRQNATPVLLFTGTMSFGPNVSAASRLVRDIMPLLPDSVEVRLVGKNPADEILTLATADRRVCVTGEVHNIVAEYQAADIFVAPLPPSAGMKNKVLEAMACGLPVIASPSAISGFDGVPPGVFVGETDSEMAELTRTLLEDEALRHRAGEAGRRHILTFHSWTDRTQRLLHLLPVARVSLSEK
jgi:glycosyltransferase involved in cell wall biosynthesis